LPSIFSHFEHLFFGDSVRRVFDDDIHRLRGSLLTFGILVGEFCLLLWSHKPPASQQAADLARPGAATLNMIELVAGL
jgi:hypothetical protein